MEISDSEIQLNFDLFYYYSCLCVHHLLITYLLTIGLSINHHHISINHHHISINHHHISINHHHISINHHHDDLVSTILVVIGDHLLIDDVMSIVTVHVDWFNDES